MYVGQGYDQQWEHFRNGDAQALGEIYDQYILLLYRYGHKLTTDRSLVEDCIQEVFAELWKRRNRISPTTSVKFYLFRALRRKILWQLKSLPRLSAEDFTTVSHNLLATGPSLTEEQINDIHRALAHLSPRQKEAVYLKFYSRLSNDQVAEVMEIDKRTVYNLISQSLGRLQHELQSSFNIIRLIGWPILLYSTV